MDKPKQKATMQEKGKWVPKQPPMSVQKNTQSSEQHPHRARPLSCQLITPTSTKPDEDNGKGFTDQAQQLAQNLFGLICKQ